MKIIDFAQIKALNISPKVCYDLVSDMIKNKDKVMLPTKISMKPEEGVFCNVMPVILENSEEIRPGGVKIVTRYPNREPSLDSKLCLYDFNTGKMLAFMDANYITAMRTGAVAVHSIVNFARKDFKTIGMLGLGNTARATILVLNSVYPDRKFNIKLLRYKNQAELFEERFKEFSNLKFEIIDDVRDLIKGSDVIISAATYLKDDLCENKYFDEGILVVPIHTRGFTNCDLFFDKVYADDVGHVHGFKNFDKFKYFSEVADVINGKSKGRENDKERIIAYNIGVAMHDIRLASFIYEKLKDNKDILDIDMHDPIQKFWL